jgi:hypothetical protein
VRAAAITTVLIALSATPAWAQDDEGTKGYGGAAGVTVPLSPTEGPGVALALSATLAGFEETSAAILLLRGEVLGLIGAETKAIMPTLSGEAGFTFGPVDLFFTGGVQIFGLNWSGDWTFFTTIGFIGGAGLRVKVTEGLQLEARAGVTWLPEFGAAKLKEPAEAQVGDLPTLLHFHGLLGVVYTP